MNWDVLSGKWSEIEGGIRSRWSKLTDDDVHMLEGKREHLVGKLVERYGVVVDEAEKQADEWAHAVTMKLDAARAKAKVDASTTVTRKMAQKRVSP
jgi:uncharacterized protein YjbJ (UPF0337 family)